MGGIRSYKHQFIIMIIMIIIIVEIKYKTISNRHRHNRSIDHSSYHVLCWWGRGGGGEAVIISFQPHTNKLN